MILIAYGAAVSEELFHTPMRSSVQKRAHSTEAMYKIVDNLANSAKMQCILQAQQLLESHRRNLDN